MEYQPSLPSQMIRVLERYKEIVSAIDALLSYIGVVGEVADVVVPVICVGVAVGGMAWSVSSFRELKLKRTLQDIPTSKINTGAIGANVEIHGGIVCEKDKLATAPITGKPCVLYHLEIQAWDNKKWSTIDSIFSDDVFFLNDGSGANAMVFLDGAIIKRQGTTRKSMADSSKFDTLRPSLDNALRANKKKFKKFKFQKTRWVHGSYRFIEWRFDSNDCIYVLGFAESGLKLQKIKKPRYKYFKQAKIRRHGVMENYNE